MASKQPQNHHGFAWIVLVSSRTVAMRQNRSTQKWMVQTVHLGVQQPPRESTLYETKDIFRQANIDLGK